jgi:hypothetical protein
MLQSKFQNAYLRSFFYTLQLFYHILDTICLMPKRNDRSVALSQVGNSAWPNLEAHSGIALAFKTSLGHL